ncbi:MAG: alkylated DNA repair dioxygenase AlkB [Marivirga sp.]|jgi:alkylated DNA repair dioxygenase AlkB
MIALFDLPAEPDKNILPYNGRVNYYGKIFSEEDAMFYYQELWSKVPWENDKALIFGKEIITKRKVAWYGDRPFSYTYSKYTKQALFWNEVLTNLKAAVEKVSGNTFNSCLLNLYHDGSEGMAWHSDGEKDLEQNGAIASVSLGAIRKFAFKHKASKEKVDVILENGSLLLMRGDTQSHWQHRLPPTKKVSSPRINLTFRTIVNQ